MLKVEETILNPELLAKAFWNLDDSEQAEFFVKLHELLIDKNLIFESDTQWYYMGKKINENPKAKNMACRMLVYVFNHATDYLDRRLDA